MRMLVCLRLSYNFLKLSSLFFFWPCYVACGILVPRPGIEPRLWQWQHRVLSTGLPGNSLSSLFKFFFLFADKIAWVPLPCFQVHRSFLLFHLVYCWTPLVSVQLVYVLALWLQFANFYIFSVLKFSLCSSILLPSLVSIFMTITLYQVNYLSLSLRFFFEVYSCSFIWNIFSSILQAF